MPRFREGAEKSVVNDTCEVEQILQSKELKRTTRYLVKWKGYDSSYNEWVDQRDLECPELLQEFLEKSGGAKRIIAFTKPGETKRSRARNAKEKPNNKRLRSKQADIAAMSGNSTKKRRTEPDKENIAITPSKAQPVLNLSESVNEESPISKILRKKELSALPFKYEYPLAQNEDTVKAVRNERHLLGLTGIDFWRILDEYNYTVRKPVIPGEEYLIKEFGPFVGSKATYVEECYGCDVDINKGDWYFWHSRERFLVDMHFCQCCVAFILYSFQVLNLRPAVPSDAVRMFHKVLKLAYPGHFASFRE